MRFAAPSWEALHEEKCERCWSKGNCARSAAACCAPTKGSLQMNIDLHARAERLIAQDRVEGIPRAEREWLGVHLQDCARCNDLARQTEQALQIGRASCRERV